MPFLHIFKKIGKFCVQKFLEPLVKLKLARTRPTIIGITGSFGKTSTKEAIYEVLNTHWPVERSQKSLNTEIGLLLAVLHQSSGFSSPAKWIKILVCAVLNAFFGRKSDFLILEYGADKPGDIAHLVKIVKPHIAVITHISAVHQDKNQFKNIEEVFNEKKKIALVLDSSGIAILNRNDKFLQQLDAKLRAKIFWFNSMEPSINGIRADNLKNTHTGFSATIHMGSQKADAHFCVAGGYHIDIFLPAILCGILQGLTLQESVKALENFRLQPGRMSILEGKNGCTILDSSYNASPETMREALNLLKDFPGKRKIAVIGNMNELGECSREEHIKIAHYISSEWLDELITVGELAHIIASECLKKGFLGSKIKLLLSSGEAGKYLLSKNLKNGDVILFKGSQNRVRLERAVKMLMAHPEQAKRLLCRQEPEWEIN
ncbi:UDP-N-acetylmuramoyl-tripeptide--D-alanyl-D-alanine ligase [Candidatus Peregrinibacteria bacterium]|nr:UDP-N-acetylmuramoyl-tripeptide--D-alanyl-D-alanine ligase [Candidatus Peregrinibacteria bacterium]